VQHRKFKCHQCRKLLTKKVTGTVKCDRCKKRHWANGKPKPYTRCKYWVGKKLKCVPKEVNDMLDDPYLFGYELGHRKIKLASNPYFDAPDKTRLLRMGWNETAKQGSPFSRK
jgi:hypothetical protein